MPIITATPAAKQFSWSFSRLKAYEDCPRRCYETQILKKWPEEKSEQLQYGDAVHAAMAQALRSDMALPEEFAEYQHWVDKVRRTKGELLVENQWAIDKGFKPVPWFSPKAWLRCIADAVVINDEAKVALCVDWKTGRSHNADTLQLTLTSLMMFIHYPNLMMIRSDFVWLAEDDKTTQVIERAEAADEWAKLLPRVKKFHMAVIDADFPPKPGNFCRSWCSVLSCEHNGRRA